MITGVLAAVVVPLGRRTSACRVTPSEDGIQASDQSASGYATPEAPAAAGIAARAATDRTTAIPKRYIPLQRRVGPKLARFRSPESGLSAGSMPGSTPS